MDQESFEEAECFGHDFPTRMANTLKVHCWNEEHGCEFEGSVEGMLRHYENECTFHAVECLRCEQRVLHRDLSTHYVARCSTDVSPAVTENTPSVSTTLILQDVSASLEELKTIMRDSNNDQLLLADETQMNELIERVRNLESRAAVSSREFGATASSEAVPISSTVLQEPSTQQQNPTEVAGTSPTSRSCSQAVVTPQSRDPFAHLPESVLRGMRKTTSNDYPQHSVEYAHGANLECSVSLTTPMSHNCSWREVFGKVVYTVIIKIPSRGELLLRKSLETTGITVLHTKDSYFKIVLNMRHRSVLAEITFFGMRGGSPCSAPSVAMNVVGSKKCPTVEMVSLKTLCQCEPKGDSWVHSHFGFQSPYGSVDTLKLLLLRRMELRIELSDNKVVSAHSST